MIDLTDPPAPTATPAMTFVNTSSFLSRAKQVFKATGPVRARSGSASRSRSRSASLSVSARSSSVIPISPSGDLLPKMEDDLCTTTTTTSLGTSLDGGDEICILGVVKAEIDAEAMSLSTFSATSTSSCMAADPVARREIPRLTAAPASLQRLVPASPAGRMHATASPRLGSRAAVAVAVAPISYRTPTPQLQSAVLGRVGRAQSLVPYVREMRSDVAMHPRGGEQADVVMLDAAACSSVSTRTPPASPSSGFVATDLTVEGAGSDSDANSDSSIVVTGTQSAPTDSPTRRKQTTRVHRKAKHPIPHLNPSPTPVVATSSITGPYT